MIQTVKNIAPCFGGINLEDIASPDCFEIEERLDQMLDIPVFHDDQHGTAVVVLAALYNALRVTKKDIKDITNDRTLLTHLNNFVHPFNSFSSIEASISNTGEIIIKINYLFSSLFSKSYFVLLII